MKQFLSRLASFLVIPAIAIIILLALYVYFDPFKVLRNYTDYSSAAVEPDRDYVSTEMFIKNHGKYNYNSFIFGSSRTVAFRPNSWRQYLPDGDSPFVFDASDESVYGIDAKLKYLDAKNAEIKNALIIVCRDQTFAASENSNSHLFTSHPALSGESRFNFQMRFVKGYLTPRFLVNFYAYKVLGKYKTFMSGYIQNERIIYDTITNEVSVLIREQNIANDPAYYEKRKDMFYVREGEQIDSVQRISSKQLFMLQEIKRILEKHKTSYKVILSPLYEQMKFSSYDMGILRTLFGDHLFDFSGKNQFTEPVTNYYESSHYRPVVGDSILHLIYGKKD
ncbi:MAG TPA: hypothetical protein VLJ68_00810 [Chitinophagaceae bacterium]|nr:hypothetical protein [Chitinophagaceae bacterium]